MRKGLWPPSVRRSGDWPTPNASRKREGDCSAYPGLVVAHRLAHQGLEGRLVDLVALAQVDRAAGVAGEAGVEQVGGVGERGAVGEGELDVGLVDLAGAEDAGVFPDGDAGGV